MTSRPRPPDSPVPVVLDAGPPPPGLPVPAPVAAEAGAERLPLTASTTWNYGPQWQLPLLDAYGIAPDPDRTRYYRPLWDLGP